MKKTTKIFFVLLLAFCFVLSSCKNNEADFNGLTFGSAYRKVASVMKEKGWEKAYSKRSFDIYRCAEINGIKNPLAMLYYSGKGTGKYNYSCLTFNLFNEDDQKNFDEYFETEIARYNLHSDKTKKFDDGKIKEEINTANAEVMLCHDYTVTLYKCSETKEIGREPIELVVVSLNMESIPSDAEYVEKQVYYLSPKAQKLISSQLFEEKVIK